MPLLAEIRDATVASAKGFKERATQKGPGDIPHLVEVYRGGTIVATLFVRSRVGGSFLVWMIQLAAAGFDADAMTYVMESLGPGPNSPYPLTQHPATGKPLQGGDLNKLVDEGGLERGLVTESLLVTAQNRAGDVMAAYLPYHYAGGRHLVWDEPEITDAGEEASVVGAMADPINAAMTEGLTFSQVFPGIAIDELSRAEVDTSVAQVIGRKGNMMPSRGSVEIMLWTEPGSERERVLREQARGRNS